MIRTKAVASVMYSELPNAWLIIQRMYAAQTTSSTIGNPLRTAI